MKTEINELTIRTLIDALYKNSENIKKRAKNLQLDEKLAQHRYAKAQMKLRSYIMVNNYQILDYLNGKD